MDEEEEIDKEKQKKIKEEKKLKKKRTKCERYSRVVGYLRPVEQWNEGKQAEFKDRKMFKVGGDKIEKS